jgi:hypothetical protein
VLERDVPADDPIPADEAGERFASVVTAMRLWAPGGVRLGAPGWRQLDHARWQPVPIGSAETVRGGEWMLHAGDEQAFREFFTAVCEARPPAPVAWALHRFEIGCGQATDADALSDYLLGLRGLLDATTETGQASFGLRLAALCAEKDMRRELQARLEAALALERYVMGGSGGVRLDAESPRELVAEMEGHLRALLRDVLCGYLDADLKAVADDILIESGPDPQVQIHARDLRAQPEPAPAGPEPEPAPAQPPPPAPAHEFEPRFEREPDPVTFEPELEWESEPDTAEMEPVAVAHEPVQHELDGVTESADWGWDDPEDFSAPV